MKFLLFRAKNSNLVLCQLNKNKIFSKLSIDTTCCFFHSFLSGSVVVLQTLPKIWTNPLLHRNV
uniref:Photochlorophyllide reductase subunit B n=1 Tax=Zanthoxylum asiaticum TaxID=2839963 RepID=A0A7T0M6G8_9ROSI|nr:photochlorophyllide reductase subunit B [Zanthoxylum asiaticum]QPL16903.1 photochlorophyllide reductase subunit B [Zanthoxylum asiaticum]